MVGFLANLVLKDWHINRKILKLGAGILSFKTDNRFTELNKLLY